MTQRHIHFILSQFLFFSRLDLLFKHSFVPRCGNVAAILELNEHLQRDFTIFEAAPQESRGIPSKKPQADYFLWESHGSTSITVRRNCAFYIKKLATAVFYIVSVMGTAAVVKSRTSIVVYKITTLQMGITILIPAWIVFISSSIIFQFCVYEYSVVLQMERLVTCDDI